MLKKLLIVYERYIPRQTEGLTLAAGLLIFSLLLITISCVNTNKSAVDDFEIDDEKFRTFYYEIQDGVLLSESDEIIQFNEWDADYIVEKVFINPVSANEIYYTGTNSRGRGAFWIIEGGDKKTILESGLRYGPMLIWHGENIAEIFIPTGSPNRHSYYFDFRDKKLSQDFGFPVYYDIESNVVLIWGLNDFELYDTKTGKLIREYNIRRNANMPPSMPIPYYIEKGNGKTILFYYDDFNTKGRFTIDISL